MKKFGKVFAVLLAAVMVFAASAVMAEPAEPAEASEAVTAVFADTTGGQVFGYRSDGVDTFFDIKYGEAERFQPATPASWEGVRICNVMGEIAPQSAHDTASRDVFNCFPVNLLQVESEKECLNLNVWTPQTGEGSRPVVVWFHGGGFQTGSSTQFTFYLGESFAKAYDCVFVSVNHRLNVLGFTDLSAYGEEYKYSGNVGQSDLELSLQWIQDNIATFGGDPSNVTIVGQSGGGSKVTALMSTPSAKGLFHKAVALSGGSVQVSRTTETAQADTEALIAALGLEGSPEEIVDQLVSMPYEQLLAGATAAGMSYGPVVDGDYIPTGTYEMSADIPFIASNVMGEFTTNYSIVAFIQSEDGYYAEAGMDDEAAAAMYVDKYTEEFAPAIMDAFKEAYPNHPLRDGLYLNDRYGAGMSALPLCDAMASYGGTVYNSLLAYDYAMYGGIVPIHTASSIPFWFNNVEDIPDFVAGDVEGAQAQAAYVSGALAAFAYTGNPSTEDMEWEAYTPENGATMVFDGFDTAMKYNFFDKPIFDAISAAPSSSGESAAEEAEAAESEEGESEEGESAEGESEEGESPEGEAPEEAPAEAPEEAPAEAPEG